MPTTINITSVPVTVDDDKCIAHKGCTVCVDVCPLDVLAIDMVKGKASNTPRLDRLIQRSWFERCA